MRSSILVSGILIAQGLGLEMFGEPVLALMAYGIIVFVMDVVDFLKD